MLSVHIWIFIREKSELHLSPGLIFNNMIIHFQKYDRASLVVQWLKIHLPKQGTWV